MKIKFLAKPPGTDYERGQVVAFDDKDWVAMSYPQKYLREGIAEEVIEDAQTVAEGEILAVDPAEPPTPEGAAPAVESAAGTAKGGKGKK